MMSFFMKQMNLNEQLRIVRAGLSFHPNLEKMFESIEIRRFCSSLYCSRNKHREESKGPNNDLIILHVCSEPESCASCSWADYFVTKVSEELEKDWSLGLWITRRDPHANSLKSRCRSNSYRMYVFPFEWKRNYSESHLELWLDKQQ